MPIYLPISDNLSILNRFLKFKIWKFWNLDPKSLNECCSTSQLSCLFWVINNHLAAIKWSFSHKVPSTEPTDSYSNSHFNNHSASSLKATLPVATKTFDHQPAARQMTNGTDLRCRSAALLAALVTWIASVVWLANCDEQFAICQTRRASSGPLEEWPAIGWWSGKLLKLERSVRWAFSCRDNQDM